MSYKILLADDSVTVQKIITLTFSDEGVDVLTVNNGDDAIHRLQYLRPALVMADVSIPGKNGYEICEFIRNHSDLRDTPVILLVPAFEPFDEERARRVGADYHLTKPFQSIRTLIATVKSLIEPGQARPPAPGPPVAEMTQPETGNAKIEELLRQSSVAVSNGAAELGAQEPFSEISVVSAPVAVETEEYGKLIDAPGPAGYLSVQAAPGASAGMDEFEDLLELDDVLPELHAPAQEIAAVPVPATVAAPPVPETIAIPQQIIDEIVDRVVAQVTSRLSETLLGDLARRLAPEVAGIVETQYQAKPAPLRVTESLLDID
ncbi:MAG: response regulator [Blastocatellia bacterium]